jgi:tetratricopeptide (TPR) repeat protein
LAALEARTPQWHARHAAEQESRKNWFAAAWHLERMAQASNADDALRARLARAQIHANNYDRIDPVNADRLVSALNEDDVATAYGLAWFYLRQGRLKDYQRLCVETAEGMGSSEDPFLRSAWLRLYTVGPDATGDAQALVQRVRSELASYRQPLVFHQALGGALYRAGQYEDAIVELTAALEHEPRAEAQVLNWLFLALAHQQLGRADEARLWLGKADAWIARVARDVPADVVAIPDVGLRTAVSFRLLRREAALLIGSK